MAEAGILEPPEARIWASNGNDSANSLLSDEAVMNGYEAAHVLALAVGQHLSRDYGSAVVAVGFSPAWDVRFQNGRTYEIKLDLQTTRTHNACIEFWDSRRNCPSGILATQASHWLHCVPENGGIRCYEIEVKKLLKLCMECGTVKQGGDFNSSVLKLIPMNVLAAASTRDFLLRSEFVNFIRKEEEK